MSDLVYIVGEFPSVSETFILREMLDLVGRGFPLRIYALRQPRAGRAHAECAALMDRVTYRPRPGSPASLAAHLSIALRRPARYAALLAGALREGISSPGCLKERLAALDAAAGLVHLLGQGNLSHLHGHFAGVPATAARYAARLLGVPFSFSAHAHDIYVEGVADRAGLAANLRAAAFVVTCTEYNRRHLLEEFPELPPAKLHRVYHRMDPDRFRLPNEIRSPKSEIGNSLLAVGRLLPKKGLDVLIAACGLLRERGHEFSLTIVGDGPEGERLLRLAEAKGIAANVTFCGEVTQEDLIPLYAAAAIFALPCVVAQGGDRDGLPNVVLEAMASGLPVVSTPVSGIPEAVEDKVTGLLVPPGDAGALADALERLMGDPELRRRLGDAGCARARRDFDIRHSPLADLFIRETARVRKDML